MSGENIIEELDEAACQEKVDRFIRSTPKILKPGENPVLTALLEAFAKSDCRVAQDIQNTKAQLFVRTAEGTPLNKLANSLGVSRPVELGLDDATFQELIPNLSLKAKQIRKAFYDTSDVFWGPLFSRANVQSANFAPYNVSPGDEMRVKIDNRPEQTIAIINGDVAIPGAATAEEMANILAKIIGATSSVITDSITGNELVNLRTNTPGPLGAIEIFSNSTMIGSIKLDFPVTKTELRQQTQRVSIYEINPNEILIEIPAVVPALRRTLKGSHHFHADSTLEPEVAPSNCKWEGSFFFDPAGVDGAITVTGQSAQISEFIAKGSIKTSIIVDDSSKIEDTNGFIVLGYGTTKQSIPIRIRGVPNNRTVLIDPGHNFEFDHKIGTFMNIISAQTAYAPERDGSDLPIYMTSPSDAREAVEEILRSLAAAGVIVNFVVLAPDYKYLCDNPYIDEDNAPSA
jgi:hypothetical protein